MTFNYRNLTSVPIQKQIYAAWYQDNIGLTRKLLIDNNVISNCESCWDSKDAGDWLFHLKKEGIWVD